MNLVRIGTFGSYESLAMANHLASILLKHGLDTRIISLEDGGGIEVLLAGLEANEFDLVSWKKSQLQSLSGELVTLGSQKFVFKDDAIIIDILCSGKLRESSRKEIKEILDQHSYDHKSHK